MIFYSGNFVMVITEAGSLTSGIRNDRGDSYMSNDFHHARKLGFCSTVMAFAATISLQVICKFSNN